MARPGLGAAGVGVLALRAVALKLRLDVFVLLRAEALPAQRVCGKRVETDMMGGKKVEHGNHSKCYDLVKTLKKSDTLKTDLN